MNLRPACGNRHECCYNRSAAGHLPDDTGGTGRRLFLASGGPPPIHTADPAAFAGMKPRVRSNLLYLTKVRGLLAKEGERVGATWRLPV